jgi:hypothetical protein
LIKHFTLLLLFVVIASEVFAQIKKGQFLLGGSVRFESIKTDYSPYAMYKSNNIFISPDIGCFIINKLAGGLRIDFSSSNTKADTVGSHSTSTTFSPFIRYYLLQVSKKVNAFTEVSYVQTKTKWRGFNSGPIYGYSNGFQISAGPSIFLTDQIALEFIFAFRRIIPFEHAKINTFSTGLGLQVHFGKIKTKKIT